MELVRAAGGNKIDDSESATIADRAGGNPYFIIETTGMLMADGATGPVGAAHPPPTVQGVVSARLGALPPRLRELARRASVFLYSFNLPELAIVDAAAKVQEVQLLEDAEILVRDEGAPTQQWRTRPATPPEVPYASLPKRERLRLHELIADNLLKTGHPSWAADH